MRYEKADTSGLSMEQRFEILEDKLNSLIDAIEAIEDEADRLRRKVKEICDASENKVQ